MVDVVISIVGKVGEYLVVPLIREGKYFFCVNNFIGEIDNEKNELISERDNLMARVEQAKQKAEEIEKPVEKWLSEVENLLKEVEDLDQRMKASKNCFQGRFPLLKQYRLCKKMVKKKEAMGKFRGKSSTFQPFSHRAPLPGIQYPSLENFTYFESTKVANDQLLEALQDEKTYIIGVYGMGGSGKTSLVTGMGKMVERMKMFDKVILITISQTPNIRALQGQMADALNLTLEEESEGGRAQRLWLSLKEKSRILIIVDDLWRKFNLMDIGINLDNESMGPQKIILTTRNQHICDLMHCQKKIYMGLLHEGESWALFQKHANIDDKFSESLDGVPKTLCLECKGLPIAVKIVGSSLKGKSKADWKMALHCLSHPYSIDDQVEGVGDVLNCLKLSYDYLGDEKAKILFLMCSMFPEDSIISIEDLIRYAIGLGLGGVLLLELSRDVIEASINRLLESCLLMRVEERKEYAMMRVEERKEYVMMHDMVRDTALWIAKTLENHKILVNVNKPFNSMVDDDGVRDCFAISSWYYDRGDQNYHLLHAPNLKILLIRGFFSLSHATFEFEGIEGLQILSIINDNVYLVPSLSLPTSIQFLTNLQTLCLNGWPLGDISFISCLKKLQILDLQHCSFNELPNDLGNLEKLKLLDLTYCQCVQSFGYNGAIGRCLQLEEIYLSKCMDGLYYSQCVEDIITLPKLERFVIHSSMGDYQFMDRPYFSQSVVDDYHFKSSRILHVLDFDILKLQASKRNLLQLAETVHFEQVLGGFKNIFPEMLRLVGGMNSLKFLHLTNCSMIERIFDSPSDSEVDIFIPKLVELVLVKLEGLKELFRGTPLQMLCFFKLEKLEIESCSMLRNIFPWECNLQNLTIIKIYNCKFGESLFSICNVQSMHLLEEIFLVECDELKHIIAYEREQVSNTEVESIVTFPLQSSQFTMPRLKRLLISECRNLVSTFPICCFEVAGLLEVIRIQYAPSLRHVFSESDHQFQNQNTHLDLNELRLNNLENLVGICPQNHRAKCPSSKMLDVINCPKLSASWIAAMTGSKNEYLNLEGFSELSLISRVGPTPSHILNLQCLKILVAGGCKNLKYIFSMEMHRCLPELISLKVYNCNQLEQIVFENEELVKPSNVEVCFPKLADIDIHFCNKMKSLFSVSMATMLPQLTMLSMSAADNLEQVFRHDNGDNTLTDTDIILPNLTQIKLQNVPSFVDICKGFKLKTPKLLPLKTQESETEGPNDDYESATNEYNDNETDEDVELEETHGDYDLDLS